MALSNRNIITQGLSGLVGNSLVFRQRFGKTVVANAPSKPRKSPSKAMLKARYKFKQAAKYAQHALKDPAIKAGYQSVTRYGRSAFNTAFADYLKAPEIEDGLTFSDYQGQAGYEFKVAVIDDFKVKRVHFILLNLEGYVVESGDAIQQADGLDWVYISKVNNLDYNGGIVQIKAYDYPDNETIAEVQLDKEVS